MVVFNTDLDNTLIYSYKYDIGFPKKNVEVYNGREISFITNTTYELLQKIQQKVLVVPTTTRTIEQYNRINLDINPFKYALVCNGGVLLENGEINKKWYEDSKKLIASSNCEMEKGYFLLNNDVYRCFELRYIENMFLFTKSSNPSNTLSILNKSLDLEKVRAYSNGEKIYVVPLNLSKGDSVLRFKDYIGATNIITVGDSEFDLSMVEVADLGIVPSGFKEKYGVNFSNIKEMSGESVFSEELLLEIIKSTSLFK